MAEIEPALPVIPVLAYANPRGGQPLNGRLNVEFHADGVTVTDPKSAATSPVLIRRVGAVMFIGGIGSAILSAVLMADGRSDNQHLIAALAATVCGGIAYLRSSKLKNDPRIIRVTPGRIHTTGCPWHDRLSGRFRPKGFLAIAGSTDLRTMQAAYYIRVIYTFGISFQLAPYLTRDEALWAVNLMNHALKGSGSKP